MATVTPNFNWPVPTSTDLVKDGATAIEALGDSIDASLLDLKGGTTGQVLSKNSNTDMDFIWVTDAAGDITGVTAGTGISGGGTSGTVTVTNSMATAIDAKGDLVAGTGADAFARLAVGANDLLVTAASGEATGLKYTGAWTTYTPTFTNLTVGNGTLVGRYCKIGKVCHLYIQLIFGSTTSISGTPTITLPIDSINVGFIAPLWINDIGTADYYGGAQFGTSTITLFVSNSSTTYTSNTSVSATIPMTWTTSDKLTINASYEVA
jgi:hypothetical protein